MVALLTSVRNSPCFGGLRRTKTCHWQLFARPSSCFLVLFAEAKRINSFPFGNFLTSRKFAPVGAARCACFCRRAEILGASGRRPLPVHAKRVCRLLLKHSQAAKPPFGRSLSGTFHLLLKKQDKTRGVGRRPLPVHAKRVQMHHASRV